MNTVIFPRYTLVAFVLSTLSLFAVATAFAAEKPKRVLVVSTTAGFRHTSIEVGNKVIADLARQSGDFAVDIINVQAQSPEFRGDDGKPDKAKVTEANRQALADKMSAAGLKQYDAVIFNNTTGDLPLPDREAFLAWIKSG